MYAEHACRYAALRAFHLASQVRSIAVEYCDRQQALNEKLGEIYGATCSFAMQSQPSLPWWPHSCAPIRSPHFPALWLTSLTPLLHFRFVVRNKLCA